MDNLYKKVIAILFAAMVVLNVMMIPVMASAADSTPTILGPAHNEVVNPLAPNKTITTNGFTKKYIAPGDLVGQIVKWILALIGIIALVVFIIGGFFYLSAAGNPDRIAKGTKILTYAIIGLVIIFASYAMVDFITRTLSV